MVTVCGEGKVFSAGHDLADVKGVAEARERGVPLPEVDPLLPEVPMRSWYFPKPLIAGVHGFVGPEALKTIATFDFVQRVVAEADLRAEVRAWAEHLAGMPSGDVQIAKQGIAGIQPQLRPVRF